MKAAVLNSGFFRALIPGGIPTSRRVERPKVNESTPARHRKPGSFLLDVTNWSRASSWFLSLRALRLCVIPFQTQNAQNLPATPATEICCQPGTLVQPSGSFKNTGYCTKKAGQATCASPACESISLRLFAISFREQLHFDATQVVRTFV